MSAARPATKAVAADVSRVVVKKPSPGLRKRVVRSARFGGVSTPVLSGEAATFPPSATTSGLNGHFLRSNRTEVRLTGESSPRGATGWYPSKPAGAPDMSSGAEYAPTVRAFHD